METAGSLKSPAYTDIPSAFRHPEDKWNKLAYYVMDEEYSDLRLKKRETVSTEKSIEAWTLAIQYGKDHEKAQFVRAALIAWLLWSVFEDFYFWSD